MVARIATNRKEFKPTLMHSKNASLPPCPELGIDKVFLNEIIKGMRKATEQGTARRCQIKGISIAGKTGTGQWRNHNMNLNLAWFVGFAPVEEPEIAVATLVEGVIPQDHVQGGLTATPIARDLIQAYFEQKNAKLAFGKN
jgi:penicillin-binding protein 2